LREHYNPRLSQLLARTAEVLQAEDAYMQDQVDQLLPRKLHDRFGFVAIPRELLVNQPLAIQRRVIRRLLTAADDLGALVVDYEHTTKLLEHILSGSRSWEYPVSANVSVIASQGWLFFLNRQDRKPVDIEVAWTIPSAISIPTLATRLSATRTIRPINGWSGMDCLDVSLEACRLGVRAWRPGDLITLPDGLGRKKLSDLFVDRKIPLPHRHRIPIVTCNDEVVWVVGVMVAGDYRPAADTEAALMLEYDAEQVEGGAIL
jgi:tRNA(Ile)-lysidine synthase